MCRRVTCRSCGKPSWAGCGAHVDQVLRDVPRAQRCRCREEQAAAKAAAKAQRATAPEGGSWWRRLVDR